MPLPTNRFTPYNIAKPRKIWPAGVLIAWLALTFLIVLNLQNIFDYFALVNYHPPATIKMLISDDSLTPQATKIFEVNHPAVESAASFSKNCPNNGGEKTIVLGCYHSDQAGIFLLKVSDPRLNGVMQVTAAHEMLHAAYDRLSSNEKSKVNDLLLSYYHKGLSDQRIKNTIDAYKKSEPGQLVNEMHSIFGTEVANLPIGLENYYAQYFKDRGKVTAYAQDYENAFTSRQKQISSYKAELNSMLPQIDSLKNDLSSKYNTITSEQNTLMNLKNSDPGSYNQQVPGYNQQINEYNSEAIQLRTLIDNYNEIVGKLNNIVLTENQLYQELNAGPSTIKH